LERATRIRPLVVSVAVALATAILMLATEPQLAIGWDEGYTLGREARLRDWFRGLRDPAGFAKRWQPMPREEDLVQWDETRAPRPDQLDTRAKLLFDPNVLAWFWPFAREEPHGHPPFYALVGLVGDVLAPSSWQDLPRARMGPILLFSLTAGAIFPFVAARRVWAAVLATVPGSSSPICSGTAIMPPTTGSLTSLWVLAILVFAQAVALDPNSKRAATHGAGPRPSV
jgi:hypothetical protein